MRTVEWVPGSILLGYGVLFGARALGRGPLGFDDHPGQLARLVHVIRNGPAPWAWHAGWWGGYAEMQFYPPGWFYPGAAVSWLSLGAIPAAAIHHAMVWLTLLAPGVAVYLLLRHILGDGWSALPGAFLALTLSGDPAGGNASGIEGGVHIGMVAARMGWALLPVLALTLARWTAGERRVPRLAIVVLAAIILTHPAHTPAALAILGGALLAAPRPRALKHAAATLVVALALVAFWLVPLLARLEETRALAWGSLTTADLFTPLGAVLLAGAIMAVSRRRPGPWGAALHALWLGIVGVAAVRWGLEPLGLRFLPSDRVADGTWMLLVVVVGLGFGAAVEAARRRMSPVLAVSAVLAALIACAVAGSPLVVWPKATAWPDQTTIERGLRLADLWRALADAPPGRVLFLRSSVPLVYGTEWYRPHTHVTSLTPLLGGRDIVGGTFTHGSPVAAFVYRGDAGPAPLTRLAEQLDGHTLFGQALGTLDVDTVARYAARWRIAAVVALEDDALHLGFLPESGYRRRVVPPFLVFVARKTPASLELRADGRWIAELTGSEAWRSAGMAYSPMWRVDSDGRALITRRGVSGDLEVAAPADVRAVTLVYRPGWPELGGLVASVLALASLTVDRLRRRGVDR